MLLKILSSSSYVYFFSLGEGKVEATAGNTTLQSKQFADSMTLSPSLALFLSEIIPELIKSHVPSSLARPTGGWFAPKFASVQRPQTLCFQFATFCFRPETCPFNYENGRETERKVPCNFEVAGSAGKGSSA